MLPLVDTSPCEFAINRYPAAEHVSSSAVPLVLLHGWGCDSECWQPLLPHLQQHGDVLCVDYLWALDKAESLEQALQSLLGQLPKQFMLLGWSLGGMLATRLVTMAQERVYGLITLATNLKFVASEDWPEAMAPDIFQQFYRSFAEHPEKILKRFSGLMAKGDQQERQLLKELRGLTESGLQLAGNSALSGGLALLGELDNREEFARLSVPGLHLLGDGDALVPAAAGDSILALANQSQCVEVLTGCSHALQYSQQSVVSAIENFLERLSSQESDSALDKRRVAASFGKAAATYDSVAGLQRQIGHRLLVQVETAASDQALCLDLGCGTGHFVQSIQGQGYQVLGLDLAQGMLEFARKQQQAQWLCADAENLPLADNAVDAVFSSLAIQWCHDLPALFGGLKRIVKPGGRLYLATLGPRTLNELRHSWQQVDGYVHVNRFIGEESLQLAIAEAGLKCRSWQQQDIVLQYDALRDLTYELKTLGAHNVNAGQGSGLTGRARIRRLREAYESFRMANGKLPATYDVYYMELEA
jgi:malonyl-CoA O-methyltransferase